MAVMHSAERLRRAEIASFTDKIFEEAAKSGVVEGMDPGTIETLPTNPTSSELLKLGYLLLQTIRFGIKMDLLLFDKLDEVHTILARRELKETASGDPNAD